MAYAVAGLATASGSAISAEGAIHYSGPIDYKFQGQSTFKTHKFPLSNGAQLIGAINDVQFLGYNFAYFGVDYARVSNFVRGPGRVSSFLQLSALPGKSLVSAGHFFPTPFYRFVIMQDLECDNPYWQERGTYYVGFRFNTGAGPQYGWVRIHWGGCTAHDYNTNDFSVRDYAWGDPGDQIKTGQRQLHEDETQVAPPHAKSADAIPLSGAQGSSGLLALGAIGLRAWRESRPGKGPSATP